MSAIDSNRASCATRDNSQDDAIGYSGALPSATNGYTAIALRSEDLDLKLLRRLNAEALAPILQRA